MVLVRYSSQGNKFVRPPLYRFVLAQENAMQFRCCYCGATKFRDLQEPGSVECLACGRTSMLGKPEAFACPNCGSRSFMIVPGSDPMEVECLKCETVSPFSVPTTKNEE